MRISDWSSDVCSSDLEQLRWREAGQIGPDDERRFALPDEDVGGRTQGFDLGDADHLFDPAADPADDELHDPEIIKDRDEAREEDDPGKRRDSEDVAADFGARERADDEIDPGLGTAGRTGRRSCREEGGRE